nr:MAG TPA: hypothetical protein [Caudoviricetes sp.]
MRLQNEIHFIQRRQVYYAEKTFLSHKNVSYKIFGNKKYLYIIY